MTGNQEIVFVPGSVARVWSRRHGVWHKGVLDWSDYSGTVIVIHNSKDHGGAVSTSLEEFSEGQPVQIIWVPRTRQQQEFMITRARQGVGRIRFDLLESNCEDFVNWVRTGVAYSETRSTILLGLLTLATFGFAYSLGRSSS